jgi:hypothetical protein
VECFKRIQASFGRPLSFDEKKKILETQLFGIDIDQKALQITAFSLYLALLETEDPNFIRNEIQHAHPILPSLIGSTLMSANAITDGVFKGQTFEYIVSNPPWGSVPKVEDAQDECEEKEIKKERAAIANKGKGDGIFAHVSDFERSQAFLCRFREWTGPKTKIAAVVKNSIFLNDNAEEFRKNLLAGYHLEKFFELSHYNKILFKKKKIGEINGQKVELGASEPCAVVIMGHLPEDPAPLAVSYGSPKLSTFAENFQLIHITSKDVVSILQSDLAANDIYWRILVNSDIDGYRIIAKLLAQGDGLSIQARSGFQPQSNMTALGNPIWKKIIEPGNFEQFDTISANALDDFDWNQNLRRTGPAGMFVGPRILINTRPLKSDGFLFRGIYVEDEIIHKDNILAVTINDRGNRITDYLPYLAILNSQLMGFLFYQLSIQWGKGEGKRDTLRNLDVEKLPLKPIADPVIADRLRDLVVLISKYKKQKKTYEDELKALNDIVFDHYGLLDYEKKVIQEFYEVNVNRSESPLERVTGEDIAAYFEVFRTAFQLVLDERTAMTATYNISLNLGALVCFRLAQDSGASISVGDDRHIINFVKSGQLQKADALKILEEDKVKLYEKDKFYLIKSNQFKDWTVRQAVVDAREEIQQFIQNLA